MTFKAALKCVNCETKNTTNYVLYCVGVQRLLQQTKIRTN